MSYRPLNPTVFASSVRYGNLDRDDRDLTNVFTGIWCAIDKTISTVGPELHIQYCISDAELQYSPSSTMPIFYATYYK